MPAVTEFRSLSQAWQKQLRQWAAHTGEHLADPIPPIARGQVNRVSGLRIEARVPGAALGDLCRLESPDGSHPRVLAEVIGFRDSLAVLAALDPIEGVSANTSVRSLGFTHALAARPSSGELILDGYGRALDSGSGTLFRDDPAFQLQARIPVLRTGPTPRERTTSRRPMKTGIRAIDGLLTQAEGQRSGIFSPAGCGKSTLLGAMARAADADAVVFALIGERGRELREFLEQTLPPEVRKRTIVVCATSDSSAMERARAPFTATTIAEILRDQGRRVLLLMDSITRYARAQRELGMAAGESPTRGGYPPSVFTSLPQLVERAGASERGSITALYTVLMEQTDGHDPITEEMQSLLDGHIVLDRDLADQAQFPAVDVLASQSRLMPDVIGADHLELTREFRALANRYKSMELLVRLGEYDRGQDAFSDRALALRGAMQGYIQQDTRTPVAFDDARAELLALLKSGQSHSARAAASTETGEAS